VRIGPAGVVAGVVVGTGVDGAAVGAVGK